MTLTLPADAEPFISNDGDLSDLRGPGVYALTLARPENTAEAWDSEFDHRPDYLKLLEAAERLVYVGAASDVLRRLGEHRGGQKRKAALLRVCAIESLRNIWLMDSTEEAFQEESRLALLLQNEYPSYYVHQR
jgi:predicted GIY-YIG superfamily endonuclease